MTHKILKVISGGQSGIDKMGLEVAKSLGIETGGTAPLDYWTENGTDKTLKAFGLIEGGSRYYPIRTMLNISNSDCTVIFGNISSPGSRQTIKFCNDEKKPYIVNPTIEELVKFINSNKCKTLNVAGNRASKISDDNLEIYSSILKEALKLCQ